MTSIFFQYGQWSAIATIAFAILTVLAFVFTWGLRFRLVGVTSFMGVLTGGLFALGLGLFTHTTIPGSVHYSLVYDNGNNQAVVTVPPNIATSAIEPTLKQAATDLFSHGRGGSSNGKLNIRLRTVIHPKEGVSQPLYLGEIKQSLVTRESDNLEIKLDRQNIAKLINT